MSRKRARLPTLATGEDAAFAHVPHRLSRRQPSAFDSAFESHDPTADQELGRKAQILMCSNAVISYPDPLPFLHTV